MFKRRIFDLLEKYQDIKSNIEEGKWLYFFNTK